uniref:Mon2/Sec7/BIG1-like dimerisation and cyclophilin-binding domain-containing protein n=1 Tax=Bos indicus x Bos taurus TaxID=30522 RepID=A0A4W2BYB0_BOBOX
GSLPRPGRAVKKLLENMQSDLRALSLECKKKFPPVKEVSSGRLREKARTEVRAVSRFSKFS